MSKIKTQNKTRGIFLTVIIISICINIIESVFNLLTFPQSYKVLHYSAPSLFLTIVVIGDVLEVVGVYGVIRWKKWGIYSTFASFILSLVACFFISQHFLEVFFATFVVSVLIFWAIFRKWVNFTS